MDLQRKSWDSFNRFLSTFYSLTVRRIRFIVLHARKLRSFLRCRAFTAEGTSKAISTLSSRLLVRLLKISCREFVFSLFLSLSLVVVVGCVRFSPNLAMIYVEYVLYEWLIIILFFFVRSLTLQFFEKNFFEYSKTELSERNFIYFHFKLWKWGLIFQLCACQRAYSPIQKKTFTCNGVAVQR